MRPFAIRNGGAEVQIDDRMLARAALSVLRATLRTTPDVTDSVMYLPWNRLLPMAEMIEIMGAHPVPARWIANNWSGVLAVGSWPLPDSAEARSSGEEVRVLREVLAPPPGARSPTVFLRAAAEYTPLDVEQALRLQQFYSFLLCGRRVVDVAQYELRGELREKFGARDDDCVLSYRRLLEGGTPMHGWAADGGPH